MLGQVPPLLLCVLLVFAGLGWTKQPRSSSFSYSASSASVSASALSYQGGRGSSLDESVLRQVHAVEGFLSEHQSIVPWLRTALRKARRKAQRERRRRLALKSRQAALAPKSRPTGAKAGDRGRGRGGRARPRPPTLVAHSDIEG